MQALLSLRQKARRLAARLCPGVLTDDLTLLRNSGYFDPFWYRQNNPDVTARDADPLRHYLLYGGLEGRSPGPKFDSLGYLESNPDVRAAGVNPLVHYLEFGRAEGRSPYGAAREAELKADIRAIQEDYIRRFGNPIDFRAPTRFMENSKFTSLFSAIPSCTYLPTRLRRKNLWGISSVVRILCP